MSEIAMSEIAVSEAVISDTAADAAAYALGTDVEIVRRQKSVVLFARGSGQSVRVSPVALDLLPLLAAGSTFEDLRSRLQLAHPRAADVGGKLAAFLQTLSEAGVLRNEESASGRSRHHRQFPLLNPDGAARVIARVLSWVLPRPLGAVFSLAMTAGAVAVLWMLALSGGLPSLRTLLENLHWSGVVAFGLIVVPLHELAHAVACRLVGVPVSSAGVVLHGGFLPGPYVDTSQAYVLANRWHRLLIPLAGPFINLVSAGAVAAILLFAAPMPQYLPLLHGLLVACLLFVFFDTNLLTGSDGSHCLEALLDDELARQHALRWRQTASADRSSVIGYRLAIVIHLSLSGVLFWMWWWT